MKNGKVGFLVGGIIALVVAAIIFFAFIAEGFDAQKIKSEGVLEQGLLYDVEGTDSYVNDDELFYIEFIYLDSAGEEQIGRSVHNYTLTRLRSMGYVTINYSEGVYYVEDIMVDIYRLGDEAVLAFEKPFNMVLVAVTVALVLAGFGMLVAGVLFMLGIIGDGKINKNGRNGTGSYVDRAVSVVVNGTRYYKAVFSFEGDDGQLIEAKYGKYREAEIDTLKFMKSFPIKYLKSNAIIDVDKATLLQNNKARLDNEARPQIVETPNQDPFNETNLNYNDSDSIER